LATEPERTPEVSKKSLLDVMKSVEAAIPDVVLEYVRAEHQLSSAFSHHDITHIARPLIDGLNLPRYRKWPESDKDNFCFWVATDSSHYTFTIPEIVSLEIASGCISSTSNKERSAQVIDLMRGILRGEFRSRDDIIARLSGGFVPSSIATDLDGLIGKACDIGARFSAWSVQHEAQVAIRASIKAEKGGIQAARAQHTTADDGFPGSASPVAELAKLAEMLQAGLLTREEFDQLKASLLQK
jgi:hypothetical protein